MKLQPESCRLVEDQQLRMKRPRGSEDDGPDDIPESSSVRDVQHSSDRGFDDPILKPEHRIFLCHSGAQKDHFVEILCEDLEDYGRIPFFDKRPASLPKGDSYPKLIRTAIDQCQMAVVVVSDEFLLSEWPMIELDGFVQRRLKEVKQKSETMLKIVPLFYGLSLLDLENKDNIKKWYEKWEGYAEKDEKIDISSWKVSFEELIRFDGIEFKPRTTDLKVFRDEIVKQICREVTPDVKWDDSHVQGGSKLCQVIQDAISGIQPSEQYGVRVVGVYGVGGMGKTTLCNLLCNKFCEKSAVTSGHVELGSKSSGELLKEVLINLTNKNEDFVKGLNEGKCWNLLKSACKQRIFLAIDNVWPDSKSLEEAKRYLNLGKDVHKESVVIVTSRVLGTLTSLGVRKEDCFAMPSLEEEDAVNVFLYHATSGNQILDDNDKQAIRECIRLCFFSKGKWDDCHFLPLALKALGLQLGYRFGKRPSEWVKALQDVRNFDSLQDEENPVFSILRGSFDCLKETEKDLFMDLVLFSPDPFYLDFESSSIGCMEWLALVHNQSLQEIGNRVQRLKERGLLEDVDMAAQKVYLHDLYREFANLEASGKLKDLPFEKRKWAYYEDSLPTELLKMMRSSSHRCWPNLTRFGIEDHKWGEKLAESLQKIKWSFLSDVVVFKLQCNEERPGGLDLKDLGCLMSLDLVNICPLDIRDGSLQKLEYLVYFKWVFSDDAVLEKLPESLKFLILDGKKISLGSGVFDLCSDLAKLELNDCGAGKLDFRNCSSLQRVELLGLHHPGSEGVLEVSLDGLQDLSKLTVFRWKHFQDSGEEMEGEFYHRLQCQLPESLQVLEIDENVSLRSDVFARCTKLSEVYLSNCRAESLDLRNCTSLESLVIDHLDQRKEQSSVAVTEASLELRLDVHPDFNRDDGNSIKLPASLQVLRALNVRFPLYSGAFNLCVNLAKLELSGVCGAGNLDFRNCSSLESLELSDRDHVLESVLELSLDGLQDLSKLTVFRWDHTDHVWAEELEGKVYQRLQCQLPESLHVLEIRGNVSLRSDVFGRCTELSEVFLHFCRAESLDLKNCKSLQIVGLVKLKWLRTLLGLSSSAATLKSLQVNACDSLDGIPGFDQLVGLIDLKLQNLRVFGNLRPSLHYKREDQEEISQGPRPTLEKTNSKFDVLWI